MAIGVGNNTTQDVGTSPATVTVVMPTGANASSVVVVGIGGGNDTTATGVPGRYTPPAGWTSINGYASQNFGSSPIGLEGWWSLGNNTNLTFTATNGTLGLSAAVPKYVGVVAVNYTGVDLTTPIDAVGTNTTANGANTATASAVTVATDQAWEVTLGTDWNTAGGAYSATGFTAVDNAGSNQAAAQLYNSTPKGTGSTGTVTVTASGGTAGSQRINLIAFALRPAATGIAFDAASNSGYQAASSAYNWNHTCAGTNRFLAVDVALLSPGQTVATLTYNGAAMTLIGARSTVTSFGRVECWGLANPAAGTNTIAVNVTGSIASAGTAVSYTGVHQTTPTEAFNSNQATNAGSADDATVTVTSVADQCWIRAAVATDDGSITAGQTGRNNVTGVGGSGANEDFGPQPPGAKTMTFTGEGIVSTWVVGGYAVRPVGAAAGGTAGPNLLALLGCGA